MKALGGDAIMAAGWRPQSRAAVGRSMALARDYLSLFKLRIVGLLVFIAVMAAMTAAEGLPSAGVLAWLVVGGALASAGASALNHYLDRDMDGLMPRTRPRPLASGRLPRPGRVAVVGVGLLLLSVPVTLQVGVPVAAYTLLGAFFYVVVYTLWLKRRSPLNIVVGGAAGSFAALAGWAAVAPSLSPLPLLIAALVFLWTPLHFWNFALVYRDQYRQAGVPMMPVVVGRVWAARHICLMAASLFLLSLVPYFLGYLGWPYLVAAVGLGVLLWGNLRLLERPLPQVAWTNYKLSGLYLAGLFVAMAADSLI